MNSFQNNNPNKSVSLTYFYLKKKKKTVFQNKNNW